jgi:hypothetical protein
MNEDLPPLPSAKPESIHVPPVDPEAIVQELQVRAEAVRRQLKALEEAKRVSQKTMQMVITY